MKSSVQQNGAPPHHVGTPINTVFHDKCIGMVAVIEWAINLRNVNLLNFYCGEI